ncbi:AEC family transporter [Piscinibacter sp.]|uniref:AEC family transporter n=1 Tax=Piscinibacter sp. TaxID=1903157 RepID=UPI0039E2F64D
MSASVFLKLAAIFVVVALGWVVGKARWLGPNDETSDPARVLANAAYYIFVPALLFRTTARLDLAAMPWGTVIAFFVPVLALLLLVYAWERRTHRERGLPVAAPSVRAISATFGNSVQVGIPFAAALFGEAGLAIHVALVSLHALTLLTVLTALVELDLARERRTLGHSNAHLLATLGRTVRNTIIHPVVLPVLAGLAWNLAALPLPAIAVEILATLAQAVVPLCLVLIGMSLAYYGVKGAARGAVLIGVLKLLVLPALVLAAARWGFGLSGLPLAVVVMMAALPVGSNALIFSQRYAALEAEATAAIVFSTLAFVATASIWLAVLAWLG